jgi:diguanylate cyclase (GGDEF)-like protein
LPKRDFEDTSRQAMKDLSQETQHQNPYLIVLSGKSAGKMFKISKDEFTVGRGSDADVVLDEDSISRTHAKFVRLGDGRVRIIDLTSTNGTYWNGNRIDTATLSDGDKIQIGSTTLLKFSYQDKLEVGYQEQLYRSAIRDGLTGVYNRKFFLDRLDEEFAYARRHRMVLSLAMFDLDHFKRINDQHGHPAGDEVLVKVAEVVQRTVRAEDVLCRYGGEEFAVILRQLDVDRAPLFGERLRSAVEKTELTVTGRDSQPVQLAVTTSVGLAVMRDGNCGSVEAFIAKADQLLYRAKETGRNRVVVEVTS